MSGKKYRLPRKALTKEEAKLKLETAYTVIDNLFEENLYWEVRKNKPLKPLDQFIIFSDRTVNSPQEIIDRNNDQIKNQNYRIDNYIKKYL